VPPGDAPALASAVLEALRGGEAVAARVRAGQGYVMSHHSSRRLLDDVDALYRELLGGRAAA
jgi:hypothetical protein